MSSQKEPAVALFIHEGFQDTPGKLIGAKYLGRVPTINREKGIKELKKYQR